MQQYLDSIPLENEFMFQGPDRTGQFVAMFYAFNTVVTLQAFAKTAGERAGEEIREAFEHVRDRCRFYENRFSRTLERSDISRLNAAEGAWVEISRETYELLEHSIHYCRESGGVFDITMGSATRLWDFNNGIVADKDALQEALSHVDWRKVQLGTREELNPRNDVCRRPRFSARLADPRASLDAGGTAKGYIADRIGDILQAHDVENYLVNLGGNVLAHGTKPDGDAWRIGIQDPRASRESGTVLGSIALENASAVTSGTYERCFEQGGRAYHHILDPKTGFPVETDLASVTVVAKTSLDAEGYSTTLLAIGKEKAVSFVQGHPEIEAAYLVDPRGRVYAIARAASRNDAQ